jgi:hypothetical protein
LPILLKVTLTLPPRENFFFPALKKRKFNTMKKIFTLNSMKRILAVLTVVLAAATQSNAQLVINEIDYDQPGTDSAEFVEIFNAGSSPVNLGDYRLVLFNGSTSGTGNIPYDSISLPVQTLNAGQFFVICGSGNNVPNCNVSLAAATNAIQNAASATATTPSPDAVFIREIATGNIIDVVSYEGDCIAPYLEGSGVPVAQSDTIVFTTVSPNSPNNFISIGRFPDGTDSNNNSADFNHMCSTPGAANVANANNCATGLTQITKNVTIQVYPNPSRGIVNIDLSKESLKAVMIHVVDMLGKEVKTVDLGNFNSIYSMDMSNLHRGIYFIKIESASGVSVHRIELSK